MNESEVISLFNKHERLVTFVLHKMLRIYPQRDDYEDCKSEGKVALISAIKSFENGRFSSYASLCIKRRIIDFQHHNQLVRLPMRKFRKGKRLEFVEL